MKKSDADYGPRTQGFGLFQKLESKRFGRAL
jgi:hypothetical protein